MSSTATSSVQLTLAQLCALLHRRRLRAGLLPHLPALPRRRRDLRRSSPIRSPTCSRASQGRRKYVMTLVFVIPLMMSYIIKIYAIRAILGGNGFLNRMLLCLGVIDQPLDLPHLQPQRRPPDARRDPPALRDPADLHRARAHPAEHPRRLRRSRRLVLADVPRASSGRSACKARSSARPSPSCWRSAIS